MSSGIFLSVISGSLSPRYGASLGCGWRNDLQIEFEASNIFNKPSRTAERGGPVAWGLGEVLTNPHLRNLPC